MIFCLYWNNGFAWLSRGYEYVLLWGLVAFAIALRGGGPYSLDRKSGFNYQDQSRMGAASGLFVLALVVGLCRRSA